MVVIMVTDDYDGNRFRVRKTYLRLSLSFSHLVEFFMMVTMMVVTMLILKCYLW